MTYDQLMRWREAVGAMPASNDDYIRGVRAAGNALAARVEALEAALIEAREVLALSDLPTIRDPRLHDTVDALGQQHGYGAVLHATAHAWEVRMKDGDPLHVPGSEHTAGACRMTVQQTLKLIDACIQKASDRSAK